MFPDQLDWAKKQLIPPEKKIHKYIPEVGDIVKWKEEGILCKGVCIRKEKEFGNIKLLFQLLGDLDCCSSRGIGWEDESMGSGRYWLVWGKGKSFIKSKISSAEEMYTFMETKIVKKQEPTAPLVDVRLTPNVPEGEYAPPQFPGTIAHAPRPNRTRPCQIYGNAVIAPVGTNEPVRFVWPAFYVTSSLANPVETTNTPEERE